MIQLPCDIIENGGECYLYGGAIRDSIIGIGSLDYDFIVRKLSLNVLSSLCSKYGVVFPHKYISGALRLHTELYGIIDIALPKKYENGIISFSENYSIDGHLASTDFTMNAIVKNMQTDKIYDAYGGIEDIKNKIISLNPTQDSLNFSPIVILRAIRFSSKFNFIIDERTMAILERDKEMMFDIIPNRRLKFEMYRLNNEVTYNNSEVLLKTFGIYDRLIDIYNKNWD